MTPALSWVCSGRQAEICRRQTPNAHTYAYTRTRIRTYTRTHTRTCIHTHANTHTHTHAYTHTRTHTCIHIRASTRVRAPTHTHAFSSDAQQTNHHAATVRLTRPHHSLCCHRSKFMRATKQLQYTPVPRPPQHADLRSISNVALIPSQSSGVGGMRAPRGRM